MRSANRIKLVMGVGGALCLLGIILRISSHSLSIPTNQGYNPSRHQIERTTAMRLSGILSGILYASVCDVPSGPLIVSKSGNLPEKGVVALFTYFCPVNNAAIVHIMAGRNR